MEKFLKLQDVCRTQVGSSLMSFINNVFNSNTLVTSRLYGQLVWLVKELVKSGVIGADGVLMTLMKQIAGAFTHMQIMLHLQCIPTSCV